MIDLLGICSGSWPAFIPLEYTTALGCGCDFLVLISNSLRELPVKCFHAIGLLHGPNIGAVVFLDHLYCFLWIDFTYYSSSFEGIKIM